MYLNAMTWLLLYKLYYIRLPLVTLYLCVLSDKSIDYKQKVNQWWSSIPRHTKFEIQVLTWDKHKNVAGLNRLMRFLLSSLNKWISNSNTHMNKR